jgi:hypothetical protein
MILLFLSVAGFFWWLGWRADEQAKQEERARKQRFEEKKQNDDFTLELFGKILLDQDDKVAALRSDVKLRDDVIADLHKQIERMNKNAEKLNLKEALNK